MNSMEEGCCCPQCSHPACPPTNASPPYDEISHEIDNNIISIKVGKDAGKIQKQNSADSPDSPDSPINVICSNAQGKKCREGCAKVNVISNKAPPTKRPHEEMLLLKSVRQLMPNDEVKNTLEIEFKAPRNYKPLPGPGPRPRIIIPKTNGNDTKDKSKHKRHVKKKEIKKLGC